MSTCSFKVILSVWVRVLSYVYHTGRCLVAHKGLKRAPSHLKQKLQTAVNHHTCVELNPGPLQEQQVFLTAESFLQSIPFFFFFWRQSLTDCNVNLARPAGWPVSSRDPPVSSPTPPATQHWGYRNIQLLWDAGDPNSRPHAFKTHSLSTESSPCPRNENQKVLLPLNFWISQKK